MPAVEWYSDAAEIAFSIILLATPEEVHIAVVVPSRTCEMLFVSSAHKPIPPYWTKSPLYALLAQWLLMKQRSDFPSTRLPYQPKY